MKFNTNYKIERSDRWLSVQDGESMTIQSEAYSIQDLLRKHLTGIVPQIGRDGVYLDEDHDSEDLSKYSSYDLVEREELRVNNFQRVQNLQNQLKDETVKHQQKQKQKLIDEQKKLIEEIKNTPPIKEGGETSP